MTIRDARSFLAALLTGLLAVVFCRADGCARVHRVVVSNYTPSYATYTPVLSTVPTYTATAYPVAVAVPLYSGYYDSKLDLLLQTLVQSQQQQAARLDSQEQFLRQQTTPTVSAIRAPSPMPPAEAPAAAPAVQPTTFSACLKCHDGAATGGKGHVLFQSGQEMAWDCGTMLEIQDRITRAADEPGVMPPKDQAPLSGDGIQAIIDRLKAKARTAAK